MKEKCIFLAMLIETKEYKTKIIEYDFSDFLSCCDNCEDVPASSEKALEKCKRQQLCHVNKRETDFSEQLRRPFNGEMPKTKNVKKCFPQY
jgi:hypothetical protein